MWERKELKQRAKACLKLYYWPAVLVVLIASVLGGSSGFTMPAASGGNVAESVETITELPEAYPSDLGISYEYEEESVPAPVSGGDTAQNAALAAGVVILLVILAVAAAIGAHRDWEAARRSPLGSILYRADKLSRPCFACQAEPECDWVTDKKNLHVRY